MTDRVFQRTLALIPAQRLRRRTCSLWAVRICLLPLFLSAGCKGETVTERYSDGTKRVAEVHADDDLVERRYYDRKGELAKVEEVTGQVRYYPGNQWSCSGASRPLPPNSLRAFLQGEWVAASRHGEGQSTYEMEVVGDTIFRRMVEYVQPSAIDQLLNQLQKKEMINTLDTARVVDQVFVVEFGIGCFIEREYLYDRREMRVGGLRHSEGGVVAPEEEGRYYSPALPPTPVHILEQNRIAIPFILGYPDSVYVRRTGN